MNKPATVEQDPPRHTGRDSGRSAWAGGKIAGNARNQLEKDWAGQLYPKKGLLKKLKMR